MRIRYGRWAIPAAALLSALVLLAAAAIALTLALKVPVDPREGWNAYNAVAALSAAPLYPGQNALWFNNYPPVSYFVVGSLGSLLSDHIVAGRAVAFASTVVATFLVTIIARRMQCDRLESLFAGLLFAASPWVLTKYAQMDDPQMLGQALGCAGFAIVVWQPGRIAFLAIGALLLALALFVKPLFVVQPLALLIWLAQRERRTAVLFLVFGIVFCVAGLFLTNVLLKTDLVQDLLLARVYSVSRSLSHPGQWLVSGLIPLLATLSLRRYRHDAYAQLCVIYALLGIPFCLFFSGGEGVAGNATFDLSIACALGTAVFVNRLKGASGKPIPQIVLACVLPMLATFVTGMLGLWSSGPSIVERMKLAPIAERDIAFLESRPGAALCEQLALCYWAGKPGEVDVWGLSQALATRTRSPDTLSASIDAKRFDVIALNPRSALLRFAELRASLARNYRIDHADPFGTFFVPLTPGAD